MSDNLLDTSSSTPTLDDNADYWNELTKEGGKFDKNKYQSEEDLKKAVGRSKVEADQFIAFKNKEFDNLRTDYLRLREENMAQAKLSDLIDQLNKNPQTTSSAPPPANEVKQPAFDPDEVKKLSLSAYQEFETQKREQENARSVVNKLKERHGDNFQGVVKNQIESLGLTPEWFNETARKHPSLVFKTLDLDTEPTRENFQAPPRSDQRVGFKPNTQKRNWSYYENMRKTNPELYLNPKTQKQMHLDAVELKEAFDT